MGSPRGLSQLPALYAYACELAQESPQSLYSRCFKPDSLTERSLIMRVAKERPEVVITNAGEIA